METADWRGAWVEALDELELTLDAAERLLAAGHEEAKVPAWTPPTIPGPLPTELVDRAGALLERQRTVIAATAAALTGTRRQLELHDKLSGLSGARQAARPVYVDLTA